jgi:hypothetical protein
MKTPEELRTEAISRQDESAALSRLRQSPDRPRDLATGALDPTGDAARQAVAEYIRQQGQSQPAQPTEEKPTYEAHKAAIDDALAGGKKSKAKVKDEVERKLGRSYMRKHFDAAWRATDSDRKLGDGNPTLQKAT